MEDNRKGYDLDVIRNFNDETYVQILSLKHDQLQTQKNMPEFKSAKEYNTLDDTIPNSNKPYKTIEENSKKSKNVTGEQYSKRHVKEGYKSGNDKIEFDKSWEDKNMPDSHWDFGAKLNVSEAGKKKKINILDKVKQSS